MTETLGLEDKQNRCGGKGRGEFLYQEVMSGERIKCQLSGNAILNEKVELASLEWP